MMSYNFDTMSKIQVNNDPRQESIGISFEEKSVWIQLVCTLLVLGGYLATAWQMLSRGITDLPEYVPVFAGAVMLMVIVVVAGHIVVAIAKKPDGRDERDRLIEWRSESQSGWLVAAGVLAGITAMILSVPNVWVAHLLLLSLVLSEVLKFVLQLVYYRRGI